MSWTDPKQTETIIKNMVGSIIGDLELFDNAEYENIEFNQQYKIELIINMNYLVKLRNYILCFEFTR